MTAQILQTIAMLCQIHAGSSALSVNVLQASCQIHLTSCVEEKVLKKKTDLFWELALAHCVEERNPQ